MNLVIKLDEETYNESTNRTEWDTLSLGLKLIEAVQNGTPLPKGHGKLIDATELKKHKYHDNDRFEKAVPVAAIDWAKAIIEADKE